MKRVQKSIKVSGTPTLLTLYSSDLEYKFSEDKKSNIKAKKKDEEDKSAEPHDEPKREYNVKSSTSIKKLQKETNNIKEYVNSATSITEVFLSNNAQKRK